MTSDAAPTFGDSLRRLRMAAGLTQPELAERAGLSVRGINDLERGARRIPRKDTVALLADALGLSPEQRAMLFVAAKRPTSPTLQEVAPAEATLDRHRHNLLIQPTRLLGREREVADLCALLRRADVRLVTLTGPGGVGKTRLGLHVAVELSQHFEDGTYLVELAALSDPILVLATIAQTLGVPEARGQSAEEGLRQRLRAQHVLLALDNCEHLRAAAPQIADLLGICPGLKILATSRQPLRLRGEREYLVPPLAAPAAGTIAPAGDLAALTRYPAIALFVQRAQATKPDFLLTDETAPLMAEICARLDGLPLAITLVAAWVRVLPPTTLLQRLEHALPLLTGGARDLPGRQHTMRETLNWSYDLLQPGEQRLFRRLAVFVGGFTLEAAEAVCAAPEGAEPLVTDVLDGLGALIDQSLVWQRTEGGGEGGEARFGMLHVIREYALEQLEASGEAEALRRAHASYYLALPEAQNPWDTQQPVPGQRRTAWLAREQDNVRAILRWALDRREAALALRLAAGIAGTWQMAGYRREGRRWLEEVLALAAAEIPAEELTIGDDTIVRAREHVAVYAADFADLMQDRERAFVLRAEQLALARALGDARTIALAYVGQAFTAFDAGDAAASIGFFEEGLRLARETGDWMAITNLLLNFCEVLVETRECVRGQALAQEALGLARQHSWSLSEVWATLQLASCAYCAGNVAQAQTLAAEALGLAYRGGYHFWVAQCLEVLTLAVGRQDQAERTAQLVGMGETLNERIGYARNEHHEAEVAAAIAPARAALGEEAWAAAFAAGRALSLEEAIAEALGDAEERT